MLCVNGSIQRSYVTKDEVTSLTAATNSVLITGIIEAK